MITLTPTVDWLPMHWIAAEEELGVLRGIRTQKRVIVSTMSGGAAASKDSYIEMWGSFLVWAGESSHG
jgi:hypothetical protein